MQRTEPPFRADIVGSFLRPQAIKDARAGRDAGTVSPEQLRGIEDREIERLIRKEEEVGLRAVTDGEFRRSWWHFDFLGGLDGVEVRESDEGIQFQGVQTRALSLHLTGKVDFSSHPMVADFKFVKDHAKVMAKVTIPSPSVLHFRQKHAAIAETYPDIDEFFADTGVAYGKAIRAFYDAGCRYLQLDDTIWAYLCSEEQLAFARENGHDTDKLQGRYADCINKALEARPDDMTVTMHVCRGNFRSTWISEGGYEPVGETVLAGLNLDGYFLEYDSERAGGFEPLRFLPKGNKMVVLGLVTSKTGQLESTDAIKARIDEATRYAPLDQLCLSPQCGFASTEEGNKLTEDEQWKKMELVVDVARQVWG